MEFINRRTFKRVVTEFEALSGRICKLRLRGKYHKLTIINEHAHRREKCGHKEAFYDTLRKECENITKYYLKIMFGNTIAKL